jgi:hypothetical protein
LFISYQELCIKFSLDFQSLVFIDHTNEIYLSDTLKSLMKASTRASDVSQNKQTTPHDKINSVRLESFEKLKERYCNFIKKSFSENLQLKENMSEIEKQIVEAQNERLDMERQIQRVSKQRSLMFRNSKQFGNV